MVGRDAPADFEIVVHVGDGKTGTSAIQKTLRQHPLELADAGIQYLGLMLEQAPIRRHDWQFASKIEAFHALAPSQAAAELADVLRDCVASARERGLHRLVLSNESLFGRGATTIAALQALQQEGIEPKIVVYVRRHDGWARSAYVQWGLRHKTYKGPLLSFEQWSRRRKFALQPKLQPWLDAFGDRVVIRNFDATADAAADFLDVLQLDPARFNTVRRNETPSTEELALRALFNQQFSGPVSTQRFTRLLDAEHVDFRLPLGRWLDGLLPDAQQLQAIADANAADRSDVDALLAINGQPPMARGELANTPVSLDHDALLSALFQIVVRQAIRLEQLEARAAGPVPATDTQPVQPIARIEAVDAVDADIAAALAPSLGYFGPLASDCLEVDIQAEIRGIRLSLDEDKPTFLNLRGLELLRQGKPVALPAGIAKASQSSVAGKDPRNGPDTLLAQTGIHSGPERMPWWRLELEQPIAIDALRICNRSDGWGSRSRSLSIEIDDGSGQYRRIHDGRSPRNLLGVVAAAASAAAVEVGALPKTVDAAVQLRNRLLAAIAARVLSGEIPLSAIDWRRVVPMLDVWHPREPSADEWLVIAAFLLSQQQGKGGTSIKSFSLLLHTQAHLQRLQDAVNRVASARGLGGFMLTRHGVKPEGVLRRHPERFLDHMEAVLAALRDLGRDPVIAYGTLLGAVREGNFIGHDDDIDLIYRSQSRSRAEVEAELPILQEALRQRGFRVVNLLPNSLNMHVIDARNGAVMDVFPCWEQDGCMQMHMESMKVRGIDPAIMYPATQVSMLGRQLPAPARPDAFLLERYGQGWHISNQFFEWPWPLKEEAAQ